MKGTSDSLANGQRRDGRPSAYTNFAAPALANISREHQPLTRAQFGAQRRNVPAGQPASRQPISRQCRDEACGMDFRASPP